MKFLMNHVNFNVQDLERSITFYKEALNLSVIRRKEAKDGRYIIVFMGDNETGFNLELTWLRDHPQPYDLGEVEFHIAFVVEEYDKAYKHHKEMGVIVYENTEMGLYFLEDPDGYWIEILPKHR